MPQNLTALIEQCVREIPDYPKPGVMFKDITPLLADPKAFAAVVEAVAGAYEPSAVDYVIGLEARGFILAAPVALELAAGFVPIRKAGKLPARTFRESYDLEYGTATIEMHTDAIAPGSRVLIVDDVLATGGTGRAAVELVRRAGGTVVGFSVLMELAFLKGREKLSDVELRTLTTV
ncbi:adenine phosphoribosyltransferase [Spinactinospora alkalitolerans]|uniref:Adenine phosphoribosyltransferase n=1 Tax=Spinactinospora alkalitolerans TaxID=687207 RepID=A0A852TSE1_9ACTN|nr:adenine phosphoribosyltransferase [Spinactinospora alkalitolerans]NYE46531.1 adenine phosphoribosyltransferase [Spinactinospora alkalitolerans]